MRVLVTDGNERSALAITRALGQREIEVIVGAETERSLAASSKYCSRVFSYPSPLEDSSGFVASILEIVRRLEVTVVFPVSDGAMSLIARQRQRFEKHAKLVIPTADAFETLSNKYRLMQLAITLGIPVPETVFIPDGHFEGQSKTLPNFPVVVKPGRSIAKTNGRLGKTGVHYAASQVELVQLYANVDYLRQPSLIQHRVEGEGQGVFALMNHGQPVALFAHRRLREKPPSGGVSVLRESVALPQSMAQYALRLLEHVGWHGVAMVEFKIDRHTGAPCLMEVNGRFWGSLQLAIDAGINFPYLLYQMAAGEGSTVFPKKYQVGVKSRWLLGDIDHLLARLFKSKKELSLPADSPTKLRVFLDFWRVFERGMRYEVLRLDDLKPFAYELHQYLNDILRGFVRPKMILGAFNPRNIGIKTIVSVIRDASRWVKYLPVWGYVRKRKLKGTLPRRIRSVLFVCQGNVCRSPTAAAYFETRLREQECRMEVRSAGLETTEGKEPHPLASEVAEENALSLRGHRTTPLTSKQVDEADLILVMEWAQRCQLLAKYPNAERKLFQLGEFYCSWSKEIDDPFGRTKKEFEFCYRVIRRSCDNLLKYLSVK